MKKKVLSLLLVAAMGISMLVGCGGTTNTPAGSENAGPQASQNHTSDHTSHSREVRRKDRPQGRGQTFDVAGGNGHPYRKMQRRLLYRQVTKKRKVDFYAFQIQILRIQPMSQAAVAADLQA